MIRLICMAVVVGALSLPTSGCSAFDVVKGVLGGGSNSNSGVQVETDDVVIGKKEEDNDVAVTLGVGGNQQAETIENQGPSTFVIILLCLLAGWAIPSPMEMLRGLRNAYLLLRGKQV